MPFGQKWVGNVSQTPTPTTCLKSTAVHLQFVRQYPPICIAVLSWLLSFEERETPQYASHLYCGTPPICTAGRPPFVRQYFWKNTGGWGHRNVSEWGRGGGVYNFFPELTRSVRQGPWSHQWEAGLAIAEPAAVVAAAATVAGPFQALAYALPPTLDWQCKYPDNPDPPPN